MITPKFTQSITDGGRWRRRMVTGKPLREAQYLTDAAWTKMAELKPNILTIYEAAAVMMVAQGQADFGGIEYSKNIYPYTVAGATDRHGVPEGGHLRRHQLPELRQGRAGARTRRGLHQPHAGTVGATGSGRSDPDRAVDQRAEFQARYRQIHRLSRSQDGRDGLFACDWSYINPIRPALLEKYNQVFGS